MDSKNATVRVLVSSIAVQEPDDSAELGRQLQNCCSRSTELGDCIINRVPSETVGETMGTDWDGTLEILLKTRRHLVEVIKALFTVFSGRKIKVIIETEEGKVDLSFPISYNVDEVVKLVEKSTDALRDRK